MPTPENFEHPILITGCARSRTSMVAGVINRCGAWGGDMFGAAPGNPSGFYENKALRERLVKPLIRMLGYDPLGVYPLPPYPDADYWGDQIRGAAKHFLAEQGYDGERWFYKGAKMAYLWPAWVEAFPDAQWVIVRRDREEIIDSCLRTPFMVQHSDSREFWGRWVDETERRLKELKACVGPDSYIEIWPPEELQTMVRWLELEWTEEAEAFVAEPYRHADKQVHIETANPVPDEKIHEHIRANVQRGLSVVDAEGPSRHETLIIVGGGPSLRDNLPALKRARGRILAINGAHDFLVERGIKPWGMMMLDPRDDMEKFATRPRKGVTYFLASQLDPRVFERLADYDVVMWHAHVAAGEVELLQELGERRFVCIAGGSTCGLRAFHLGMFLGYRKFHCFGMDSCLTDDDDHHAYEQDIRRSSLEQVVNVHAGGRWFRATGWMYAQAQDFNALLTHHGESLRVKFTGGGLLSHINDEHPNGGWRK